MDINVVGNLSQSTTAMASRSPGGANPVGAGGKAKSQHSVDKVDLIGLESVSQAFKQLKEQEPLEIPEPVGQAIRDMAQEFLDKLPEVDSAIH
ncbi:MAG: hypothetical protein HQL72_07565 [Magnetococcales bacterium]|nr:hypothetical protein [Magnetococcales bacterium]